VQLSAGQEKDRGRWRKTKMPGPKKKTKDAREEKQDEKSKTAER